MSEFIQSYLTKYNSTQKKNLIMGEGEKKSTWFIFGTKKKKKDIISRRRTTYPCSVLSPTSLNDIFGILVLVENRSGFRTGSKTISK